MKISHWFFIFLLAFGLVIVLLLFMDQPISPTGKAHEQFKTMLHSGESVIANKSSKWLAYLFGVGIIGIFGFAVSFGAKKNGKFEGIKPWLFIGVIAYLIMYTMMVYFYWDYSFTKDAIYFGGYPLPTALMLYGLSTVPMILTLVYILKFKSWILTEDDEARFAEIMKRRTTKQ